MNLKKELELILKFYNGEEVVLNTLDVVADLYDFPDEDVNRLASLLEHEPAEGGVFGLSNKDSKMYRQEIIELTQKIYKKL